MHRICGRIPSRRRLGDLLEKFSGFLGDAGGGIDGDGAIESGPGFLQTLALERHEPESEPNPLVARIHFRSLS